MTFHGARDPSSNRDIRYIHDVTTLGDPRQIVVYHVCHVFVFVLESTNLE